MAAALLAVAAGVALALYRQGGGGGNGNGYAPANGSNSRSSSGDGGWGWLVGGWGGRAARPGGAGFELTDLQRQDRKQRRQQRGGSNRDVGGDGDDLAEFLVGHRNGGRGGGVESGPGYASLLSGQDQ